MNILSTRRIDLIAFFIGLFCISAAYYLELSVGLKPCPLCIVQRFILLAAMLLFLAGALLPLQRCWRRSYHLLVFLVTALGAIVAGRHAWLQLQPPGTAPSCEASLSTLMQYLPIKEVVTLLFQGGGDCAKIDWTLLHLSPAGWSFMVFVLLSLIALWQVFYKESFQKK